MITHLLSSFLPLLLAAEAAGARAAIPRSLELPEGATVAVTLDREMRGLGLGVDDDFVATLDEDLVVGGRLVARRGAPVFGRTAEGPERGELVLVLSAIEAENDAPSRIHSEAGRRTGTSRVPVTFLERDGELTLPAGTRLEFRLSRPATLADLGPGEAAAPSRLPEAPPRPEPPRRPPLEEPRRGELRLERGTQVEVRLLQAIDSRDLRNGDRLDVALEADVVAEGRVGARRGEEAGLRVIERREAGRVEGREELTLELAWIGSGADRVDVRSEPGRYVGRSSTGRDAATVGAAGALGAILGAVTEGSKGAAVGAVAGVAAGSVVVLATRGEPVKLPSGSVLGFELKEPVWMADRGAAEPARAPAPEATPEPLEARRVKGRIELPAGHALRARLVHALSSEDLRSGDRFDARLAGDLVGLGRLLAPAGSTLEGVVRERTEAGRVSGRGELVLGLRSLRIAEDGRPHELQTSEAREVAADTSGRDAATIGATTAAGAIIGAIAEGGKGAVVGAIAGAAAGSVVVLTTRGAPVRLPAGTELMFRLEAPLLLDDLGPAPR